MYAEAQAWGALKKLIALPELSLLSHLGVLRKRRRLVLMGIVQFVDLYVDLTFPLVARACVGQLSDKWQTTWMKVPLVGPLMKLAVEHFRFWGFATICVTLNVVVTGIMGMMSMCMFSGHQDKGFIPVAVNEDCPRINGDVFFAWAGASETALMPSVTLLCEEMADQRQWMYDPKDARDAMHAREDWLFGRLDKAAVVSKELADHKQHDLVMSAGRNHFVDCSLLKCS